MPHVFGNKLFRISGGNNSQYVRVRAAKYLFSNVCFFTRNVFIYTWYEYNMNMYILRIPIFYGRVLVLMIINNGLHICHIIRCCMNICVWYVERRTWTLDVKSFCPPRGSNSDAGQTPQGRGKSEAQNFLLLFTHLAFIRRPYPANRIIITFFADPTALYKLFPFFGGFIIIWSVISAGGVCATCTRVLVLLIVLYISYEL